MKLWLHREEGFSTASKSLRESQTQRRITRAKNLQLKKVQKHTLSAKRVKLQEAGHMQVQDINLDPTG